MKNTIIASLAMASVALTSCTDEEIDAFLGVLDAVVTGLTANDNLDEIPQDVVLVDVEDGEFPSRVDLSSKFPPIGNQGNYGTCVAWAAGYNFKTALNAIDNQWTQSQLANKNYQTSPADVWYAIDEDKKNKDCGGTSFEPVLMAMIDKGASSMGEVPYSRLDNGCSRRSNGNESNRLSNYRLIANGTKGMTPSNFKYYLSQGRPIVFGARLGNRFMQWQGAEVISFDTYVGDDMQHAYHAMVLTGYDDSRHAFRVRNSWGEQWGDRGSIWVDYDFFCTSFMYCAFVGQNVSGVEIEGGEVDDDAKASGYDLMAYDVVDYADLDAELNIWGTQTGRLRTFTYEVYNTGTETIAPSMWSNVYLYYNANDASDIGQIFVDVFTDAFGGNEGDYGEIPSDMLPGVQERAYWNNKTLHSGQSVKYTVQYTMPEVTGNYYLVLMADGYDDIAEVNEQNNFYFVMAEGGRPLQFRKGVLTNRVAHSTLKAADDQPLTPQTMGNSNAYTPQEVARVLRSYKESGKLQDMIEDHNTSLKSGQRKAWKVENANNKQTK